MPIDTLSTAPGKLVGPRLYLHITAATALDARWADDWARAERLAGVQRDQHYNLIRMDADGRQIALLALPGLLRRTLSGSARKLAGAHLDSPLVSYRSYADSLNPPILHRKELLLAADHPRRAEYAALTATAETLGLFDHPTRIGYQRQWLALVREKGLSHCRPCPAAARQ